MESTLKNCLESNRLSMQDAARVLGVDKSQIVKICTQKYPNWKDKETEYVKLLKDAGYKNSIAQIPRDCLKSFCFWATIEQTARSGLFRAFDERNHL